MIDQSMGFHKDKIPATFINSDLTTKEKEGRYQLLMKKALKFLFLTPERLDPDRIRNLDELENLKQITPNFLVIDEAHCVDRWGNDFRPSYGRLADVRKQLSNPSVLAFTATAGLSAQKRILSSLGIPEAKVFISDVDRPNITLIRHQQESNTERFQIIKSCIAKNKGKSMIFVPTRKIGSEVLRGMLNLGLDIPFYHGQMMPIDREFLLGQFTGRLQPEINAIICTNAFGMGLDIPNVHLVVHWMQPESVEDYLQEFGRAGRDGKTSIALIFKSSKDIGLRSYMAERTATDAIKKGGQPDDVQRQLTIKKRNITHLDQMIRDQHQCFRQQILGYFKDDTEIRRKSIAIRIIEWLLCKKSKVKKTSLCCDFCNAKETKALISGSRYGSLLP
jgi:ATP-dependent DNA helicase RecQ